MSDSSLFAIYRRNRHPGSVLIRMFSWGTQWSHVGVLTPSGMVIEASGLHGVIKTPVSEFLDNSTAHEFVKIACPNPQDALEFLEQQVGKPYDWGAIFGIIFREPWEKPDRWICFELLEAALIAGGRRRFRREISKITSNLSFLTL